MDSKDNGAVGDKPFSEKRPVIERSKNLLLTEGVLDPTADNNEWTVESINSAAPEAQFERLLRWLILEFFRNIFRWPNAYHFTSNTLNEDYLLITKDAIYVLPHCVAFRKPRKLSKNVRVSMPSVLSESN